MSLDFYCHKIDNWKQVCYDEDLRLRGVTSDLVFGMMAISMNEITVHNWEQVVYRLLLVKAMDTHRVEHDVDVALIVRRHIGLQTNVAPITDAAFNKQVLRAAKDRATKTIQYVLQNG